MQLQYESNLRQEKIIKDKWRRYELQQEKLALEKERLKKESSKPLLPCKLTDCTNSDHLKPESMITSTSSLVISAENFPVSSLSSSTEFLTSREEKDVMNELRIQIRDLQMQVLSLNQSLEDSNRENTKLRKIISSLKQILRERLDMECDEDALLSTQTEKLLEE